MKSHYTLAELAATFAVRLHGDGACVIARVDDLAAAGSGSISFFTNQRLRAALQTTQASAVILTEADLPLCGVAALVTDNPYAVYAKVAALFNPDPDLSSPAGVHATAVIAESAQIDATAVIAPNTVIEAAVRIGAHSFIGPGTVIRRGAIIGEYCKFVANVTICNDCRIGDRVIIHPSSVIGADGFGFANEAGQWLKIPQLGAVVIGNDVEIGACVTIDRGALNDTVIGAGVKLDNQIQIAHNVTIGAHTAMAGKSAVAGSTDIGQYCTIGASAGILGHLTIADKTHLHAFSALTHSISEPGAYASGVPVEPVRQWRKNSVRFKQLDEMMRRIKALQKQLKLTAAKEKDFD